MRLALVAMLALSGCTQAAEAQSGSSCATIVWGGWDGEPHCRALAARPILGSDRACTGDADCALVHPDASCREQAASSASVTRYRAMEASCTHPQGGPCPPSRAVCIGGCCTTRR